MLLLVVVFCGRYDICLLPLSDIRRIGICLIGHQRRIISSIQSLRLQLHHIQQNGFQVWELCTKTDCVCTLSWRLTSLPWHRHSNNCTNTRLLGVAGTTRCSCESRRLLNHMWVWLKHTHHLMDHSQYSLHNNQPLSALAKCGLFVISANTSIHLNLGLSLVSIQVFTNTSSLSKWQSNGFYWLWMVSSPVTSWPEKMWIGVKVWWCVVQNGIFNNNLFSRLM